MFIGEHSAIRNNNSVQGARQKCRSTTKHPSVGTMVSANVGGKNDWERAKNLLDKCK